MSRSTVWNLSVIVSDYGNDVNCAWPQNQPGDRGRFVTRADPC